MEKNIFLVFTISMEVNNISFGAVPINKVKIKKFNKKTNKFLDYPAYFVRLSKDNEQDIEVADSAAKKWKNAKYIQNIATSAHWMPYKPIDVYALTLQADDFEKLQYSNILGFSVMRRDDKNFNNTKLYYLQVRPNAINVNNKNKLNYKHIGKSIVSSVKKLYHNITLDSEDNQNIKDFYKSNGFIEDYYRKNHFAWSDNIFGRLLIRYRAFRIRNGI